MGPGECPFCCLLLVPIPTHKGWLHFPVESKFRSYAGPPEMQCISQDFGARKGRQTYQRTPLRARPGKISHPPRRPLKVRCFTSDLEKSYLKAVGRMRDVSRGHQGTAWSDLSDLRVGEQRFQSAVRRAIGQQKQHSSVASTLAKSDLCRCGQASQHTTEILLPHMKRVSPPNGIDE